MAAKWKKVTPDFTTFVNTGDKIAGTLLAISMITVNGKPVPKYTIQMLDEDKQTSFLGGAQIDTLMAQVPVGMSFMLEFVGTQKTSGNRSVKLFDLFIPDNTPVQPDRSKKAKPE